MSNKYWTDKEDNKDIISANDFNSAFDGIATDISNKADIADIPSVPIKSISVNDNGILPDSNGNVDIDGNTIVSESYLKGNGAPTETTVADFVGQMYLDNTNTKLYQCTSITTSETDGTKSYEWIKVIRGNDYAIAIGEPGWSSGVVTTKNEYGTNFVYVTGAETYSVVSINMATLYDINDRKSHYKPIVPHTLDYAVRSVRPVTADTMPTTLAANTIYSINNTSSTSVALTLPQGQSGDFIQYDFVTGATVPTVTITSNYGMTEFDFTPEANKIYSLFFDWGIIAVENNANVYGWRISYTEYDYTPSIEEA